MALGSTAIILSHWYKLIDGLQASPNELYATIEKTLESRRIPDATPSRVAWQEAGAFSARREYLRVASKMSLTDLMGDV